MANEAVTLQTTHDAKRAVAAFPLSRHREAQRIALDDDLGDRAYVAHNSNYVSRQRLTTRGIDFYPRRRGARRRSDGDVPPSNQPDIARARPGLAGLQPGDLGSGALETLGDLVDREPRGLPVPAQFSTQPATAHRRIHAAPAGHVSPPADLEAGSVCSERRQQSRYFVRRAVSGQSLTETEICQMASSSCNLQNSRRFGMLTVRPW